MQLDTVDQCRDYVEATLRELVLSHPGWHFAHSVELPARPLTWKLGRSIEDGWYTLQADMGNREFLVWFGNHQSGAEGLHWIIRPAAHVLFNDIWARRDLSQAHFTLGDVLALMIESLRLPQPVALRFELNTLSLK